ncbi:MAG: HAD-IIIA family hydrolase [Rhodospirillales bacterium]|jgi:D-glycero-D-manno-heptose 1,7-bisphosphate phosphatase|nr:HAD-IIIA family hydrolase [Rhodospirillales bacterium]
MTGVGLGQAVFLDRDGVLNHPVIREGNVQSPRTLDELSIIQSSIEACNILSEAGLKLIGVTNQPDISRGKVSREFIETINDEITLQMGLDMLLYCPHDDSDDCHCRKPKSGMLLDGAKAFDIDLSASIMVGDRAKDIDAGLSAGCQTVFIDLGYDTPHPKGADYTAPDLRHAVPWILNTVNERKG